MQRGDRYSELILQIINSAKAPLETTEVVELVHKTTPKCTRTIVFKRLTDLRGDGLIRGKHIGSGKGVWIWWKADSFKKKYEMKPAKLDKVSTKILQVLDEETQPLETAEVLGLVKHAIPTTRAIVFKRLTNLRGDQALRGKYVGSGKGVWIWWRENAFKA